MNSLSSSIGCAFVASGVDEPNGREMGDVTSTYLLETYKQHAWGIGNGTAGWFGEVYPSVQAAARWMMNRTNNTDVPGLPTNLAWTIDCWANNGREAYGYNAIYHLSGLLAARSPASHSLWETICTNCNLLPTF